MIESTDIISKKAALKGIESAINFFMQRVEHLAAEYSALGAEIDELENKQPGPES